ncbi:MAG: prolipoprotein diacylglyceryl transferase [Coriobacteriales bacterium]|nr:prolipoprotein diacylglyceryl transferase [Coriobacteriales bacterium]
MFLNDLYHMLDPVAFSIGPISVRWYGIGYLVGFLCGGLLLYRYARRWKLDLTADDTVNIMTGICLGIILGARLGYVLFYGAGYYLQNPLAILALNEGGMSFHGGLIGAVIGGSIVCRTQRISILTLCDLGVCVAPVGIFCVRCANFINGELWGKECDLPWGVMFETGGNVYRHPSQLYEAILEGLIMFVVLWALSRKVPPRPQGTFMGFFLLWYGISRVLIEFVRVPDQQLGYLFGGFVTMGQLLSLPLIIGGIALLLWAHKSKRPQKAHLS